jgi:hypothetical protein
MGGHDDQSSDLAGIVPHPINFHFSWPGRTRIHRRRGSYRSEEKDHGEPIRGSKRGDVLQIILIQVKWGSAAMPTVEDGKRLSVVAKRLRARHVLLAAWKKGFAAPFFRYRPRAAARRQWAEVSDLDAIFR